MICTIESLEGYRETVKAVMGHCEQQQQLVGNSQATVTYVLASTGKSVNRRRFAGRKGPMGNVVGENERGDVVAFRSDELLDFLRPELERLDVTLAAWKKQVGILEGSEP